MCPIISLLLIMFFPHFMICMCISDTQQYNLTIWQFYLRHYKRAWSIHITTSSSIIWWVESQKLNLSVHVFISVYVSRLQISSEYVPLLWIWRVSRHVTSLSELEYLLYWLCCCNNLYFRLNLFSFSIIYCNKWQ